MVEPMVPDTRLEQFQLLRLGTSIPLNVATGTLMFYTAMSLGEKLLARGYGVSRYWVSVVVAINFGVVDLHLKDCPLLLLAAFVAGLPLHHVLLWLLNYKLFRCLALVALATVTAYWANCVDRQTLGDLKMLGGSMVISVVIALVMRAEQLSSQNGRMAKLGTAFCASGLIFLYVGLNDAFFVYSGRLHIY
jgi:hypothetical protein